MRREDYLHDVEVRVCRLLDTLDAGHSMTRMAIGAELFPVSGNTVLASVLGTLRIKGYVEVRPVAFGEKGARYRLTERGRLAVQLLDAIEAHEAEAEGAA